MNREQPAKQAAFQAVVMGSTPIRFTNLCLGSPTGRDDHVLYNPCMPRYTDEQILVASADATSIFEVMRRLEMRLTGGSHGHLKRRMVALGIDVAAIIAKGKSFNGGRVFPHQRRTAASILVKRSFGKRQYAHLLRRAMIESGVPHECNHCRIGPAWHGKPLCLDVDHKNEDWLDDRLENLQFLCPNCHSVK